MKVFSTIYEWVRRIAGIDADIFYTVLIRSWTIVKSPFTIWFLLTYLSPVEQGFWYSFISLGALTVFAELGFTNIITQFVSHEYAHLRLLPDGQIDGDQDRIEKFVSLVRFALKIYLIISPFAFSILSVVGIIVLSDTTTDPNIITAWIFYSLSGSVSLYVSLITAVIQGCNKVASIQKMILIAGIINTLVTVILLYLHFGIWALCIGAISNVLIVLFLIFLDFRKFWTQIFQFNLKTKFPWIKDILPLQYRYAVSWLAGYFIFYIFTPVSMHFEGAVVAGQVGLSITLIRAISSLSSAYISSKISLFNILVAKNEMKQLNVTFVGLQIRSIALFVLGTVVFISLCRFLLPVFGWGNRLLSMDNVCILAFSELCTLAISNYAVYLRAFKREPFMWLSVFNGIGCCLAILGGFYFFHQVLAPVLLYSAVQLGILVWARIIYVNFRDKTLSI